MTETTKSGISVLVPVYNGEKFLGEALSSIAVQEYQQLEVIVIDDGSTDHSALLAEATPGVCVLRKPHSGLAATLNHGVHHASGEFIAFLDADDRWLPGKLKHQLSELEQHPELDMVFTGIRQFTVSSADTEFANREMTVAIQPGVAKSALMIRASSFWRAGKFSEQGNQHDFLEWYARAMSAGLRSCILPEVLVERRVHDNNEGRTNKDLQQSRYLSTLRSIINQRRKSDRGEQS